MEGQPPFNLFHPLGSNLRLVHLLGPFLRSRTLMYLHQSNRGCRSLNVFTGLDFIHLTRLNLGKTGLICLPETLGNLKMLKCLIANDNYLTTLPDAWGLPFGPAPFSELEELHLQYNQLVQVPSLWGRKGSFHKLRNLFLGHNQLESVPESWGNYGAFVSLEILQLSSNCLTSVPGPWNRRKQGDKPGSFPSLTWLFLKDNRLTRVPKAWGHAGAFCQLTCLRLSGNVELRRIPLSWAVQTAFPKLRQFCFDRNTKVPLKLLELARRDVYDFLDVFK